MLETNEVKLLYILIHMITLCLTLIASQWQSNKILGVTINKHLPFNKHITITYSNTARQIQ